MGLAADDRFDVAVIGAGIAGAAVAWWLARTRLRVVLLERGADLAMGATRANSGILHSGIHEVPGSVTFLRCREGIAWYRAWAGPLGIPMRGRPTLIVVAQADDVATLRDLAAAHAVTLQPRWLGPDEVARLEPGLGPTHGGLLVADSAQISPYDAARAMVENAQANGLQLRTGFEIARVWHDRDRSGRMPTMPGQTTPPLEGGRTDPRRERIAREEAETAAARPGPRRPRKRVAVAADAGQWWLEPAGGGAPVGARFVVLAAGAGNHELACRFGIDLPRPRRVEGQYLLFDRRAGQAVGRIIFTPPTAQTKGFVVQETVHGNLLAGPDALELEATSRPATDGEADRRSHGGGASADPAAVERRWRRMDDLWERLRRLVPEVSRHDLIRSFTGVREVVGAGFHLEDRLATDGIFVLHGIKSPGLTAAPALGREVRDALAAVIGVLPERTGLVGRRVSVQHAVSGYVCRCERVLLAEIDEAWRRGGRCLDAIRWMTRAGMGRCQGGFCRPRILARMAELAGIEPTEVTLKGPGSELLVERLK